METSKIEQIENYVTAHTDAVSPLLEELIAETEKITGRSRWSIGRVEGKLLQLLIKISSARKVVEVGTFTGFSALVMAEALPEEGILITCENSPEFADIARRYFNKSPHGNKIQLKVAPAMETLGNIPAGSVDFVFIDADKPSYGRYFDEALRILQPGGIIFAENVFWRNNIFKENITNENARAIAAFNEKVKNERQVEKVMLSVRDGVYLIRKK